MLENLKKTFGFSCFRPGQEDVVSKILTKQDVFAVMPTGGGKSLCYQLPAVMMKGTAIVISPLISLMKDQVDAALENGIRAAYINSSQAIAERNKASSDFEQGKLQLLYIAPERINSESFLYSLEKVLLSHIVIDEAHCISEWGHDFRPDYLQISKLINKFPSVPAAAFTATATSSVQEDIIKKLSLRKPYILRASFDRPNLFYKVERKTKVEQKVLQYLQAHKEEQGIIYCFSRKAVESLSSFLNQNRVSAKPYHAGLSASERSQNQSDFNQDKINVIVATIAFGMGIDKSNVRFVLHTDLPKNIEGYYQETGRAGRDGLLAECVLFFGRGDIAKAKYFIEKIEDEDLQKIATAKLNDMVSFASHRICRRKQLLAYFGESYHKDNCASCDVCTDTRDKTDISIDAQIIMSAMARTDLRFGSGHIIDIVVGANTKRIREFSHDKIKTYGAGKNKNKNYWRFVIQELLGQSILNTSDDKFPILKITPAGKEVLYGRQKLFAYIEEEEKISVSKNKLASAFTYDENLFSSLKLLRKEFAEKQNVPPFVIFSDKSLQEMSFFMPKDYDELKLVNGVGEYKLKQYGDEFLSVIKKYRLKNPEKYQSKKANINSSIKINKKQNKQSEKKSLSSSEEKTYELFQSGLSIQEISRERGLVEGTIFSHINNLLSGGQDIDLLKIIPQEKITQIENAFVKLKTQNLKPVVENSYGNISYEEARLVRTFINIKENENF